MEVRPYEHPIKRGARNVVRQILCLWLACAIVVFATYGSYGPDRYSFSDLVVAVIVGIIPALVLWFTYRIVRFAVGPSS